MILLRLAFLMFLLSLTRVALATDCGKPISIDAVIKLSGTVTIGKLKSKFGEWFQGHGPYSWYRGAKGRQIWFYWKMPSQPAENDEEHMKYQVLLATDVNENDPDEFKIIWPKEFVGKDAKAIFDKESEPLKNKY